MITEVTMYRGTCDTCGEDDRGEFWALADRDQVTETWLDGQDYGLDDGRLYHHACLPPELCRFGTRVQDYRHSPVDGACGECGYRDATKARSGPPSRSR